MGAHPQPSPRRKKNGKKLEKKLEATNDIWLEHILNPLLIGKKWKKIGKNWKRIGKKWGKNWKRQMIFGWSTSSTLSSSEKNGKNWKKNWKKMGKKLEATNDIWL